MYKFLKYVRWNRLFMLTVYDLHMYLQNQPKQHRFSIAKKIYCKPGKNNGCRLRVKEYVRRNKNRSPRYALKYAQYSYNKPSIKLVW